MRKTAKRNNRKKSYRKKSYRKKSYRKKSYRKKIRRSPANKRRTIHKKRLVGGQEDIFIGGNESGWLGFYETFQYQCNIIVGGSGQQVAAAQGEEEEDAAAQGGVDAGYRILFGSHELNWDGGGGIDAAAPIGEGSYGVVKKVTFRGTGWGVKLMKAPDLAEMSEEQIKKYDEAHIAIQQDLAKELNLLHIISGGEGKSLDLPHPNLNKMTALIINTRFGLPWIGMELCSGQALDHNLYIEGWRPTTTAVLGMAMGIFKGLAVLHRRVTRISGQGGGIDAFQGPIIHRDIKSPNIMLKVGAGGADDEFAGWTAEQHEQNVQIIDFGLARAMNYDDERKTMIMTGCGSVLWMAPEILLGDIYNLSIDIFSVAMTILEMVSRKLPWAGIALNAEVPWKVTIGDRPTSQIPSDTPDDLKELIEKCWAKNPAHRPNATACIASLQSMIEVDAAQGGGQGGGAGTPLGYDPADTPSGYDQQSPYIQSGNGLPGFLHPKIATYVENRDGKCQMCKGDDKKISTTNCLGCGAALCESCLSQEAKKGNLKNLKRWLCKESQALVTKVWSKENANKKPCFRIETPNNPQFKGLGEQTKIEIVDETGTKKMIRIPSEGFDNGSFLITAEEWQRAGVPKTNWTDKARSLLSSLDPPAKTLCLTCYDMKPREATSMWQMPNFSVLSLEEREREKENLEKDVQLNEYREIEGEPNDDEKQRMRDETYKEKILDIWQRHGIRDGQVAADRIKKLESEEGMSMEHLFVIVNLVYEILETADPKAPPKIADEMAAYLKDGDDGLSESDINQEMDKLIAAGGY